MERKKIKCFLSEHKSKIKQIIYSKKPNVGISIGVRC
jgi:hypothetical protein